MTPLKALLLVLAAFLCGIIFVGSIGLVLSRTDVVREAEVVVCLGGGSERVHRAVKLFRAGYAEKVVVTSEANYQEMLAQKIDPGKIIKAEWSAANTYQEGLLLQGLLAAGAHRSALVVSDPYHLYRVRWTLKHFFADDSVNFYYISSEAPSLQGFWWSKPQSRLFVLSELPKIGYYWFWHGLLGIAEDPAWAKELERIYLAMVHKFFVGQTA